MNILILNWRDPKNPEAGGAEKLNYHILEPLIKKGDRVTWYAKSAEGLPSVENYKGIKIIRFGNIFSHLAFWPFFILTKKFGKIDFVFDCIHGIGYFTPLFMPKTKKKILIYEVAQNIWDEMFPKPVSIIGKFLEKTMFFAIYRKSKFWTISNSTSSDLQKMGIRKENIEVLPMGFDAPNKIKKYGKYEKPTALFVGRLVEMKGIKDAIKAISMTKDWKLNVIGRGSENFENVLRKLIKELKIENRVYFLGFVSEEKKFEEMSKAWVLVVPSSREGWGMIIPEANYVGTQVIGYDSPGIRDSLPIYSKENIMIEPRPESIAEVLNKIKNPIEININILSGWEKLTNFIFSQITAI